MTRASEKRIQLTKRILAEELVKTAADRNLDDISVKEICDHAGISRVTFYKYYRGIEDLMQETAANAMNYIFEGSMETSSLENMIRHIMLNRSLYLVLIENGYYEKEMSSYLSRQLNEKTDVSEAILKFAVSGSAGMIRYCLEKQPDISAKTLAEIILRFHHSLQKDVKELSHL